VLALLPVHLGMPAPVTAVWIGLLTAGFLLIIWRDE
jgi:hypothetical protein